MIDFQAYFDLAFANGDWALARDIAEKHKIDPCYAIRNACCDGRDFDFTLFVDHFPEEHLLDVYKWFAYYGRVDDMKLLEEKRALDPSFYAPQAFLNALSCKHYNVLDHLITRVDPSADKNEALVRACLLLDEGMVEYLCQYVDPVAFNNRAANAAAMQGRVNILKKLMELAPDAKADAPAALEGAAAKGRLDMVKFLLDHWVYEDKTIDEAIRLSAKNEHRDVMKFLIDNVRSSRVVTRLASPGCSSWSRCARPGESSTQGGVPRPSST